MAFCKVSRNKCFYKIGLDKTTGLAVNYNRVSHKGGGWVL